MPFSKPFRLGLLAVTLAATGALVSGCNTVAGMGQDASAVGHDVTGAAGATQAKVTNSTGLSQN